MYIFQVAYPFVRMCFVALHHLQNKVKFGLQSIVHGPQTITIDRGLWFVDQNTSSSRYLG